MSADRIVYCLENISDYRSFERLCSALLAGGDYRGIDPLGGTGDGGRDAIVRTDASGRRIIFAYTVRGDWERKLKKDCNRVKELKHNPSVFVYVCSTALNAAEKDRAHEMVSKEFGWQLDLYDQERLRALLVGPQRHLLAQHPSIFTPPFFPQAGGESLVESRDTIIIDHVDADHALATWLSRRLTLQGHRTWCRGTAPMVGEDPDDTVRKLVDLRASQYLPVISEDSLSNTIFLERCALAAGKPSLVSPCSLAAGSDPRLPSRMKGLATADFANSWNEGLTQILGRLTSLGVQPGMDKEQGRQIALGDYLPSRVTVAKPEPVFANLFKVTLPATMLIQDLRKSLTEEETVELRKHWAFAELSSTRLVSFAAPPTGIPALKGLSQAGEFSWPDTSHRDGKRSEDLAKELARRSLEVVCAQKGLKFCPDRKVFYFPDRETSVWKQDFRHVDGRRTHVHLTGERRKTRGDNVQVTLYQLAPRFRVLREVDGTWSVVVNVYVRVTDIDGKPFERKEIARRRKAVTKSWWNNQFLARLLGVVQALETSEGLVEIGEGKRKLAMETAPLSWQCPVGLDVLAMSGLADLGEELAEYRTRDDEDEDDATPAVVADGVGAPGAAGAAAAKEGAGV